MYECKYLGVISNKCQEKIRSQTESVNGYRKYFNTRRDRYKY